MIAAAPLASASPYSTIADAVAAYLEAAKAAAAGGITWAEFGELLVGLVRLGITVLDATAGLSGAAKKEIVLEAAAALFDLLADRIRVPALAVPLWLVCRPAVRSLVLALASGAVEALLPLVRLAR